jgi:hypothetical protein
MKIDLALTQHLVGHQTIWSKIFHTNLLCVYLLLF